jgi:hypothetical protein
VQKNHAGHPAFCGASTIDDLLAGEAGGRAMLTVNVWYSTKDTDPFTQ